ncbi:hypothetical protein NQZ79_g2522 [Umbelopsis isabellina]|nr:hypothetical protein NQZ79_g2522 [Umbelopsis isabellina]
MGKFHLPVSPAPTTSSKNQSITARQKEPLHFRAASNRIAKKAGNFLSKSHTTVISSDRNSLRSFLPDQPAVKNSPLRRAFSFKDSTQKNKTPNRHLLLDQSQMQRIDVAASTSTWRQQFREEELNYLALDSEEVQYQEAIYEIIATEADYVNDLKLVYKIFVKEALEWEGLPKPVRLIFSNIYQIIKVHQNLLDELRKRQTAQYPVVKSITDKLRQAVSSSIVLLYLIPMFHIYAAYFINFEKAIEIIKQASDSRSDIFGTYLRERNALPDCRNLPLHAFLLKPVQRITKYPLFFKSLLESTKQKSFEHQDIRQLLQEMESAIAKMQEEQAKNEEYQKLEDLEQRIAGFDVKGYLTVVNDPNGGTNSPSGSAAFAYSPSVESFSTTNSFYSSREFQDPNPSKPMLKRRDSAFGSTGSKEVYAFLFNDLLLWTKVKSKPARGPNVELHNHTTEPSKAFYGPHAGARLKLCSLPAKLTHVVENVPIFRRPETNVFYMNRNASKSGYLGGSMKSPAVQKQHPFSASHHSLHLDIGSSQHVIEIQPLQFACSVAHRNSETLTFQATSEQAKLEWCSSLNNVLGSHVHRINDTEDWWKERQQKKDAAIFNEATLMAPPSYRRTFGDKGVEVQDIVGIVGMLSPSGDSMIPIADVLRNDRDNKSPTSLSDSSKDSSDESSLMELDADTDMDAAIPQSSFDSYGEPSVAPVEASPFMPRSRAQKQWQSRASKLAMGIQDIRGEVPGKVIRMKFGQPSRQRPSY